MLNWFSFNSLARAAKTTSLCYANIRRVALEPLAYFPLIRTHRIRWKCYNCQSEADAYSFRCGWIERCIRCTAIRSINHQPSQYLRGTTILISLHYNYDRMKLKSGFSYLFLHLFGANIYCYLLWLVRTSLDSNYRYWWSACDFIMIFAFSFSGWTFCLATEFHIRQTRMHSMQFHRPWPVSGWKWWTWSVAYFCIFLASAAHDFLFLL